MIVRPELMSARSAPSARPLKSCETKLGQVTMKNSGAAGFRLRRRVRVARLGVVAELAAERVRLLHERGARDDLEDGPEVFLVLHLGRLLALHDDHRADELVVLLAEVHLAHRGL